MTPIHTTDDSQISHARLAALQAVTAAFSAVLTPAEVSAIALTRGCAAIGASGGVLRVLSADGRWLERIHISGSDRLLVQPETRIAVSEPYPLCETVRTGLPIWLKSLAAWRERYPTPMPALAPLGDRAVAALPLIVGDRIIGAIGLIFDAPRLFDPGDREFMMTMAQLTAQAFDRAQQFAAERARADRYAGLQTVTAALSAVRTPEEVAGVVVGKGRAVLGAVAATVRVLTADGQALDRLMSPIPAPAPLLYDRLSLDQAMPACDVVRTGHPVWLRNADEWRMCYPLTADPILDAGYQASATLPLNLAGTPIGTLGFSFGEARQFDTDDRDFMLTLAELTAQALDRARLYAAEQERARVAEELARLRNTVVAMVSHELRTPLTAIVGFAEILEARWASLDDAKRLDWVAKIKQSANRQLQLVEDVLLMSQLEHGDHAMKSEAVQIEQLARRAAAEITMSYPGQVIQLSGQPGLVAVGDRGRILQILVILLDNAAKYSPQGSAISLAWAREIDTAVLRVADHGSGIPSQSLHRLFRPFGRLDGIRPRAGKGSTGLGLYIGRELASGMGGDLTLERTGPAGSVFALRLLAKSIGPSTGPLTKAK